MAFLKAFLELYYSIANSTLVIDSGITAEAKYLIILIAFVVIKLVSGDAEPL